MYTKMSFNRFRPFDLLASPFRQNSIPVNVRFGAILRNDMSLFLQCPRKRCNEANRFNCLQMLCRMDASGGWEEGGLFIYRCYVRFVKCFCCIYCTLQSYYLRFPCIQCPFIMGIWYICRVAAITPRVPHSVALCIRRWKGYTHTNESK